MRAPSYTQSEIDRIVERIEEKADKDGKVTFRTIATMTEYNKDGGAARARGLLRYMVSEGLLHTEQIKSANGKWVDWYWLADGVSSNGNNNIRTVKPVGDSSDNNIKITGSYTLEIEGGKQWGGELVNDFAKSLFALIGTANANNGINGGSNGGNLDRNIDGNKRRVRPGDDTNEDGLAID